MSATPLAGGESMHADDIEFKFDRRACITCALRSRSGWEGLYDLGDVHHRGPGRKVPIATSIEEERVRSISSPCRW